MRWVAHVAHTGKMRSVYKILVGKQDEKRPLARPRQRWEDNIGMGLREIGREVVEWIHLAEESIH